MITLDSKKRQQGFTLVEVIVVAIIVAALAAVAVPMYTSYVSSSRENAAANAAGSVASFLGACINQGGTFSPATIAHNGTANTSVTCNSGSTVLSTMQLPADINVAASGGVVTAYHVKFATGTKTYNYAPVAAAPVTPVTP